METTNVIRNRKSVREYANKVVKQELIDDILSTEFKSIGKDISFGIYKDGQQAYLNLDGKVGYYGKMIEAPHYLYILSDKDDNYMESTGYVGEKLALKAADLGLGTCWIDMDYNKEVNDEVKSILQLGSDKVLTGLLAIGYPKRKTSLWTVFKGSKSSADNGYAFDVKTVEQNSSQRLSIGEIVYIDEFGNSASYKDLEKRGLAEIFYYVRLAPSWGNRQPWKYLVTKKGIELYMRADEMKEETIRLEAGVAMLYFELASKELGVSGLWNFDSGNDVNDYYYIGTYR